MMIDLELGTIAWKIAPMAAGLAVRDGTRWYYFASEAAGDTVMVFDGTTGRLAAAAEVDGAAHLDRRPEVIAGGALAPRADGGIAVRDVTTALRSTLNLSP